MPLRAIDIMSLPGEFLAGELDAAAARLHPADDRLERRRLADAVAAQERDGFAGADGERDRLEDVALAVVALERVEREQRRVAIAVIASISASLWPPR